MAALMTASEVAAHFGCSVRTVNRMAQTRVLPALKRGKHWRFSPDAVAAYEAAHTTVVDAPAVVDATARRLGVSTTTNLTALPEVDGELPPRWWESRPELAASPTAGRGRTSDTKRRTPARN